MQPTIISKLPQVGTTIFTTMSSLAMQYGAINLGQGFPDFPMDERITGLVTKAMRDGHNQYVHMNGLPLLREKLAAKANTLYGANVDADTQITVTPGATYAIYTALTAIIQPGDEVIIFEPAYDSYIPNIEINGGVVVPVQLDLPGYTINWDTVKAKISAKTKAIIINTPHNPSGAVITEHDIAMLREVVEGTGIIIISDEVYEHLIFDGKPHLSILRYPDLYERSFVCYSFGKTYHCTGWKMGYCFAPAPLMAEFRKVHQFNAFTCNTPMQHAFAGILDEADLYLNLGRQMQAKRDHLANGLKGTGFEPLPSYGSYFQVYSYAALTDEKEKEFAVRMTKEIGVATIPVSAFYKVPQDNHVVRFCFAKKEETLDAAVEKIRGWVLKC